MVDPFETIDGLYVCSFIVEIGGIYMAWCNSNKRLTKGISEYSTVPTINGGGSANFHFYQQILGEGGKHFYIFGKTVLLAISHCITSEFSRKKL